MDCFFLVGDNADIEIDRLEAMSAGVDRELEPEREMIVGPRGEALRPPGKDALLL